jgi:hypothetical protein
MPETMAERQSRWQAIGGKSQPEPTVTKQVIHWQERRERLLADSETTVAICESLIGARSESGWPSQSLYFEFRVRLLARLGDPRLKLLASPLWLRQ